MALRLNLGCGNDYREGYVNLDHAPEFCTNGVDLKADIRALPYDDNSVDEIMAQGCLEHLSYRDHVPTLLHWYDILKPGGKITIESPDLKVVINELLSEDGYFISHAYETLYGGQRIPSEYHVGLHEAFAFAGLLRMLGFMEIERLPQQGNPEKGPNWNWRFTAVKTYPSTFPRRNLK